MNALRELHRPIAAKDERQARRAASDLVSQLFFAPLLAEMRKSPFGTKFGGGGRGEEVFGEQLDLRIADTAAAADSSGLVKQLAAKLTHQARMAASETPNRTPRVSEGPNNRTPSVSKASNSRTPSVSEGPLPDGRGSVDRLLPYGRGSDGRATQYEVLA
jgi:Rod binding domain-containing protein